MTLLTYARRQRPLATGTYDGQPARVVHLGSVVALVTADRPADDPIQSFAVTDETEAAVVSCLSSYMDAQ